jgi:hypothetical protein
MPAEAMPDPPTPVPWRRPLTLLRAPQPALAAQHAFTAEAERVLRQAGTSGERLTTALYLILSEHAADPVAEGLQLRCRRCRLEVQEPAMGYPCPTAQQAFWALDASFG